jgi:hypothetical protein
MLTWFLKLSDCIINICSCICITISHQELLKSWNYVCCLYFQSIIRDRHIADVQVVYETIKEHSITKYHFLLIPR